MADSSFWQDQEAAKDASRQLAELKEERQKWENIDLSLAVLAEEAAKIGDKEEARQNFEKQVKDFEKEIGREELKIFFGGPYDRNNAILTVMSGAGGTEAQDWSGMLWRMYQRFCERRGFKIKTLDEHVGQEAGLKSAAMEISGPFAYGYLKGESGVHRLVRLSPFNANNLRHTSFALIEVLPEIEDISKIKIKPDELKIDTFRSSGPGGQNVNKLETAIRITHLPSGIVVACQVERSQSANREQAMKLLYAKLYQLEEKKKKEKIQQIRSGIKVGEGTAEWGGQIRNYVLHPYKLVKDLRTGVESKNPERVLDGELDEFVEAEIKFHKTHNI